MRKLAIFLLFLLLPAFASAEVEIELSAEKVLVGGLLEARITSAQAVEYRYTLLSGGKKVFEGDFVPHASGFYRPLNGGDFVLQLTARTADGREETAERAFQVTGVPNCTVTCDQESVRTGEALTFSVDVQGGVGGCTYVYSVFVGTERILREESREPQFVYTPGQAGMVRMQVEVTDAQGGQASASAQAMVEPGKGVSLSGGQSAFYTQGGVATWIVHAPGVWTARAEGDFIHLDRSCGGDGDPLTVVVEESEGVSRSGSIIVTAGDSTAAFPISQSRENGEEEELRLSSGGDRITVEGAAQASWLEAEGARTFAVSASRAWTAECDGDFVTTAYQDSALLLRAEENPYDTARSCRVTLTCGSSQAYIYVFQGPAQRGAAVQDLSLSANQGRAYEDAVVATVLTSADAERLIVSADEWNAPLLFTREQANPSADGLTWQVALPLRGEGEQTLLFSAEGRDGSGIKQIARVLVTGEAPAFAANTATLVSGEREARLSVRVTAATRQLELLDGQGQILGIYPASQAEIDRCVTGDALGRYADWALVLAPDARPAYVRLGTATVPVVAEPAPAFELTLYSQQDGWWKDKQYRHSTLEHSGCAIFALSHALQLLGFTGDEILPENLARTYYFCLLEGGTMNSTLVGHAGDDFGFKTRYDLYTNLSDILKRMDQGAVFSFSVANGHIALAAGVSPVDRTKIHIIDSAPSATFARIKGSPLYYQREDGAFIAVSSLDEIPGSRYFFETDGYGGLEYYLDASYVAKRGVRLIQLP